MKLAFVCLCAFFGLTNALFGIGKLQKYAVKGKLLCGTVPASKVKVKLIDDDFGKDDVLDEKTTDSYGEFMLQGQTNEITNIDPILKIYHDCDDGFKPGQRRWKMELPDKYIATEKDKINVLDIGVLNLEPEMHEEERDYIN